MRFIILGAKFLAHQRGAKKITLDDFFCAYSNIEIIDKKFDFFIEHTLEYIMRDDEVNQNPVNFTFTQIQMAEELPSIDFDNNLNNFLSSLKERHYSVENRVSYFSCDEYNRFKNIEFFKKLANIKETLQSKIYSQDEAIEAITDKLTELHYSPMKASPKGIFLFLGPPATGKTYLAELLSETMGEGYPLHVFDMTTYSNENQSFELIGGHKSYNESKEGWLTSFIRDNPKGICVFDEIEKAHTSAQTALFAILARGKTMDKFTEEVIDFTQSIFIFTSNLGSEIYANKDFQKILKENKFKAQSIILEAISKETKVERGHVIPALNSAFVSRLRQGETILFDKLDFNALFNIINYSFNESTFNFKEKFSLPIKFTNKQAVLQLLLLSFLPHIDPRELKARIYKVILDPITDFMRDNGLEHIESIHISLDTHSKNILASLISDDNQANTAFLHESFRKNESLTYKLKISLVNGVLELNFNKAEIVKLPKSNDFGNNSGSILVDVPDIRFTDIAGHDEAKKRLSEIANYFKNADLLKDFDIQMPRGMLLYGPPGTGKTMLAKAFANYAQLPFISTTGDEMLDISTMKAVFKRAREYAPSIIFIDEMDAFGCRNGTNKDIIINAFLTELNGFGDSLDEQIFVMGATNLKEKIDPAILRSGRIDLHVKIDKLDKKARAYFIEKILQKPTEGEIDKQKLIDFTAGMSGADLEKVSREASLECIRTGKKALTEDIILEVINTTRYGAKSNKENLQAMLENTAYHESGHAILTHLLRPEVKIEQITVAPRSNTLGFVSYNVEDLNANMTFQDIKDQICICFGGRSAEIKYAGADGLEAGASSDLDKANRLAMHAIARLGMSEELGYISTVGLGELKGTDLANRIETECVKLLSTEKQRCDELINQHWEKIERVAQVLLERETISEKEFISLLK